jgi:TetR/AcrR family fatty acid metabolism transcriptional regulator
MKNQRKGRKENTRKRDAILEAALEVFAQMGFLDATISEIAKKASVAEATIYEYFENKENLLFSIPAEKQKEALDLLEFQLAGIKGALNKIRKFVWFYLWFFQNNRPWSSVALMILRSNKKFLWKHSKGHKYFRGSQHVLGNNRAPDEPVDSDG